MPCYRCGERQVDPDRGSSPWLRGVRAARQVLICPGCQSATDWMADLDRCAVCGSAHLVRRLGEVECRDCGAVGDAAEPAIPGGPPVTEVQSVSGAGPEADEDGLAGLAEEVEQALRRVLRGTADSVPPR